MAEVNKISSFKSFSEIKAQENEIKLREENNLKKQETLVKIEEILDEMGLTSLSEIDEDSQQAFISKLLGREMNEGNTFVYAAAKAKADGKTEFEFNGKTYRVTIKDTGVKESVEEGNAFGDAVAKAKEAGEKEFEFDGKTYKVEESEISEGVHGMATKLLQSLIDGETSKVEGVKMSKELAQHYIDWIRTSPYGKKNGNLPLNMLIDASFNWGIERGTDANLKSELKDLKGSIKESFLVTEGTRGQFGKIDKKGNITAVYTHYDSYPENVLPIIKKSYKNVKDVDAVIAKGDNSGLEVDFDKINFYGKNAAPYTGKVDKIKNFIKLSQDDAGAEYIYLFDERDNKWYMVDIYGGAELVPAFESVVTEAAVKQFDADFNNMVKNIKSGYGWIDPEYVADTWENSSDSIDFELVKGEIYKRLIAAKLLAFADDEDEESAGQYVKSLKELGIKESVEVNETEVNEAEIKSDDEFKEYAMSVLKKAFGADFDEAKAEEVANGILKKCDGDYGACIGMLTSSLGESVTNEATIELDATDPKDKNLGKLLKKHNVTLELINKKGPSGYPEVKLTGDVKDLKVVLADDEYGWDDEDLADYIEESTITEAIDVKYWEDYHEKSTKITSASKVARAVEDEVEDWNDNNEEGPDNEVTNGGEKKVMNLAHDFFKAAGWISSDVIQAMIAQES